MKKHILSALVILAVLLFFLYPAIRKGWGRTPGTK